MVILEEQKSAEVAYVSDTYSAAGVELIRAYRLCAAAVNSVHRSAAKTISVPVLVYGDDTGIPLQPGAIVDALKALLSKD